MGTDAPQTDEQDGPGLVVGVAAEACEPHGDAGPLVDELSPLPDRVQLRTVPRSGHLPPATADVRFLIASYELAPQLPQLLAQPALQVLQWLHAGVDMLLPQMPADVTLCNASGPHDGPVAEWVVACVLALRRRLPELLSRQARGEWDASVMTAGPDAPAAVGEVADLAGAHVLVVGHGAIGRALQARLEPFGARVTGVARRARDGVRGVDELPGLLGDADVVVLLVPYTGATHGMVDAAFLGAMRDGAILVNVARGPVVDTDALVAEVASGRLRAALDVTDPEPLPGDHPLWRLPGVIVTPHVAGAVSGWRRRAWAFAGEQLRRYAAGEPLRNVRTEY